MNERSEGEIKKYREERKITVKGENIPKPVATFEEARFPKYIQDQLMQTENFKDPTIIQSQGWPVALSGRDMIGIAETGSGKTLAYMLPAIVHVNAQDVLQVSPQTHLIPIYQRGDGPIVLVLAPTRELVMQIEQQAKKFASACKISSLAVYGGVPRQHQQYQLEKGKVER